MESQASSDSPMLVASAEMFRVVTQLPKIVHAVLIRLSLIRRYPGRSAMLRVQDSPLNSVSAQQTRPLPLD